MLVRQHPFRDHTSYPEFVGPNHLTIAELCSMIPDLPSSFWIDGRVFLGEHEIPSENWMRVRPLDAVYMRVELWPQGGGGGDGKNPFAIVAGIFLAAVTAGIGAGLLAPLLGSSFAAGQLGAQLAAGLVGIGGRLLLGNLFQPPLASLGQDIENAPELGVASGSPNVLEPETVIPAVVGSHKVAPPQIMRPYTVLRRENEVGHALFALAGPHQISDLQINGIPVDDLLGVEYEVREGWDDDAPISMATQQTHTQIVNQVLSKFTFEDAVGGASAEEIRDPDDPEKSLPQEHVVITRADPDEITLRFQFLGAVDTTTVTDIQFIPIRLKIRKRGETVWKSLIEIIYHGLSQTPVRRDIKLVLSKGTHDTFAVTTKNTWVAALLTIPGPTDNDYFKTPSGTPQFDSEWTDAQVTIGFREESISVFIDDSTYFNKDGSEYEISVQRGLMVDEASINNSTYIWSPTAKIESFFDVVVKNDTWEALKGATVNNEQVSLQSVMSTWLEHPAPSPGLCLITLKFENISIQSFTVTAGKYVRDLRDGVFSHLRPTSNPVPHYREALVGGLNKRPLDESYLGDDTLKLWYAHVVSRGYECNAILQNESVLSALELIAATGRARIRQSDDWSVAYEHDRSSIIPSQFFSPRNSRSIKFIKKFDDMPSSMRVTFADRDNDYKLQQVVVSNPFGGSDAQIGVQFRGLVTEAENIARAQYDFAQLFYRSTLWTLEAGIERLVSPRGTLVGLHTNILTRHVGQARIRSVGGSGTLLTLDDVINYQTGEATIFLSTDVFDEDDVFRSGEKTYVAVRQAGGTQTSQVTAWNGTTKVATLPASIGAAEGDMVFFGPGQAVQARMLVLGVDPTDNMNAEISLVPEAPELTAYL